MDGSGSARLRPLYPANQGDRPEERGERVMRMGGLSAPGRRSFIWVWDLSPGQNWDFQNLG